MVTIQTVLTVAGSFISILLVVIAYFLKRLLVKFDQMNLTLSDVVTKLAVQGTSCRLTHEAVNERLKIHSDNIKEINNILKKMNHEN